MKLQILLNISFSARPAQIQDAYNKKHAELSGSAENDSQLKELEDAYAEWESNQSHALAATTLPPTNQSLPINPSLTIVDNLDTTIEVSRSIVYIPCPYCSSPNPEQAQMCSSCGKQISRPCPNCGKVILLSQQVCPRCNTIIQEIDRRRLADGIIASSHIKEERQTDEIRHQALKEGNQKKFFFGCAFWIMVILAIIIIYMLSNYFFS